MSDKECGKAFLYKMIMLSTLTPHPTKLDICVQLEKAHCGILN